MICLAGNLPALKVGRQKVVGYPTDWIELALARAAKAGGQNDCPFLNHISEGILHYLEKHCSLKLFPIEDLYARMRAMLHKIGCPDIANNLSPLAPPVTVSLIAPALRATCSPGESIFEILNEEIQLLHQAGAELIRFCDIDESVQLLSQGPNGHSSPDQLKREIVTFLSEHHHDLAFPHRDLQLTLEP